MELVHKSEQMLSEWFKQAPHLPTDGRKWLADNAWWIVIIGVVISGLGILALVPLLLGLSVLTSALGAYGAAAYTGLAMLGAWVNLAFMVAILVVEAMAIKPLQNRQKKGWDLLLLAVLLSVVSAVVGVVLLANIFGIITAILTLLIGGYFLFEIRDHFGPVHSKAKSVKTQAAK